MAFWRERLAGMTPLELPVDQMRPQVFGFQGRLFERPFPDELRERLEQLGHREGSTLFMTTLAAYVALLHRLTGQEDLTVAVPISNRNQTATEPIVGTFVNTLVIRNDLTRRPKLTRAAPARARHSARRIRPSRRPLREASGRTCPQSGPQSPAVGPGHVQSSERAGTRNATR